MFICSMFVHEFIPNDKWAAPQKEGLSSYILSADY